MALDREMVEALSKLYDAICEDYSGWTVGDGGDGEAYDKMRRQLSHEPGRKYLKILKGSSVWGFIVLDRNNKKFEYGDILMAATYKAPATNHSRGNIFGGYKIRWTGPEYMDSVNKARMEMETRLRQLSKEIV